MAEPSERALNRDELRGLFCVAFMSPQQTFWKRIWNGIVRNKPNSGRYFEEACKLAEGFCNGENERTYLVARILYDEGLLDISKFGEIGYAPFQATYRRGQMIVNKMPEEMRTRLRQDISYVFSRLSRDK